MAKKSSRIQVASEVTNSKDGSQRRLSTGGVSPSNGAGKTLPHYLRASTGSCHDFCKYGRKHAFDDEGKLPVFKGITVTSYEGHNSRQTVTKATRQGTPMTKPKLSSDSRIQVPDTSIIKKIQGETVKPVTLSPVKSADVTEVDTSTPDERRRKPVVKHKSPPDPRIHPRTKVSGAFNMIQQEAKIFKKESLSSANTTNAAAKTATTLKSKPVKAASPSSALSVPGVQTGQKNSGTKKINKNETSKLGQTKAKALPRISLSVKTSINRVASLKAQKYRTSKATSPKNQEKVKTGQAKPLNEEKVIEKTLYVIEPKPEIISMEAPPGNEICSSTSSPSSSSSSPVSSLLASSSLHEEEEGVESESTVGEEYDSILEHDETENQLEKLKDEFKKRLRRAVIVHPENDELGWKLKFRRGKIVDLPSEKNGPRRLKFRKGRRHVDNQNGRDGMQRKSLKQSEVSDGDTNSPEAESEKVILRHQDANGKKDAQGLLNNVIEETASKLVETRKSKVKALVGAFETVISLQDGKPSATNAS